MRGGASVLASFAIIVHTGEGVEMARIMVIDDEQNYIRLVTTLLKAREHEVIALLDSREALARFRDEHELLDLVVLDLNMPYLSGQKLLEGMRAIDPRTRIVVNSGTAPHELAPQLQGEFPIHYLHKPFSIAELYAVVDAALTVTSETPS